MIGWFSTITAEYCAGFPLYLYTQIERDSIQYYEMFLLLFFFLGGGTRYILNAEWVTWNKCKVLTGRHASQHGQTMSKSEQCCWTSARLLSSAICTSVTFFVTHKSKTESIKINTVNLLNNFSTFSIVLWKKYTLHNNC